MTAIFENGATYDAEKLKTCISPLMENPKFFKRAVSVMVNVDESAPDLFSEYVAAYQTNSDTYVAEYSNDRHLHPIFTGTYLEEVYKDVKLKFEEKGMVMGRARIMTLGPLRSLRYHRDSEAFRFHIPVWTNPMAFFINNGEVERMPEEGSLYEYDTSQYHTAINMSHTEYRIHLVFERYHGPNVI